MTSYNRAIIVGRLGRDPEIRHTQSGAMVATLNIATDESYTPKGGGQREERTEWHRVVVWGKQAEFCERYLGKGRLVLVDGRLQTREWTDKDGNKRFTTEINAQRVLGLDRASGGRAGDDDAAQQEGGYDDEIPF